MKLGSKRMLKAGLVCLLLGLPASGQTGEPQKPLLAEDVFKNIQVLKGIPVNPVSYTHLTLPTICSV